MPHDLLHDITEVEDSKLPRIPELSEYLERVRIIPQSDIDAMSNFLELDRHRSEAQHVIDELQQVISYLQKAVSQMRFYMKDDVLSRTPLAVCCEKHRLLLVGVRAELVPYIRALDKRIKVLQGTED